MKRTKAANKLTVTFDYETELFVPVEDGEFVLIRNGNETVPPIVLPRSSRFVTRRHFYDFYQDSYHCAKPGVGEVQIIQAAAVARVADGWKLQESGILEVLEDQPKKKAPADVTHHQADTSRRQTGELSLAAMKEESPVAPCAHCGSLVETRYAFCWKCGNPLTTKNEPPVARSELMAIVPSAAVVTEEEEPTAQHHRALSSSSIFSWALPKEAERPSSANGVVLKLIAAALVGGVLVSLGLFELMRWASRMSPTTATQAVAQEPQGSPGLPPGREVEPNLATEPALLRTSAARPEDDELKKLRERRIAAGASDRSAILEAFATAEKQYTNNYRLPYERAKLAIKADERHSHDEAFAALSLAAQKAINSGKAVEMLDSLEADKNGDFRKLSHGHGQWTRLQEALKNKDKSLLSVKLQH